jgi:hypothetical protein
VSLTLATAEAPTVLSLIGCTRLRAVSGILRTQRGRRGSRGAGLHAGTGSAGPGRRGRPGPISTDLASRPVAQVLRSPLWLKSHARPCGSRPTLAPVAQVSRSPLWLYSGRRRDAGPGSHLHRPRLSPLWLKSHARPCGSRPTLAPVAQVSRSPLWLYSGRSRGAGPGSHLHRPRLSPLRLKSHARPCGSTLAPVALLWPASGSAQLPLVMGVQPGCVLVCRIAGPYRHCRPRWVQWGGLGPGLPYVDRRLHRFLGGPATVGAGPLMCADSWAVTVWRIASAARLRQSRGHRTERGQPVSHQLGTTAVALSAKLAFGACQPARCPGAGGDRAGRHRARQSQLLPTALIGQRLDHARHFTRPVARSPPADPRRLGCGPGQPDLAATTTRGHDTPRPDP